MLRNCFLAAGLLCLSLVVCAEEVSTDDAYVGKSRYLDLMEKAVGAYTPEQIEKYVAETEKKWISEHGFARLTSNIGILIAHGAGGVDAEVRRHHARHAVRHGRNPVRRTQQPVPAQRDVLRGAST